MRITHEIAQEIANVIDPKTGPKLGSIKCTQILDNHFPVVTDPLAPPIGGDARSP